MRTDYTQRKLEKSGCAGRVLERLFPKVVGKAGRVLRKRAGNLSPHTGQHIFARLVKMNCRQFPDGFAERRSLLQLNERKGEILICFYRWPDPNIPQIKAYLFNLIMSLLVHAAMPLSYFDHIISFPACRRIIQGDYTIKSGK